MRELLSVCAFWREGKKRSARRDWEPEDWLHANGFDKFRPVHCTEMQIVGTEKEKAKEKEKNRVNEAAALITLLGNTRFTLMHRA